MGIFCKPCKSCSTTRALSLACLVLIFTPGLATPTLAAPAIESKRQKVIDFEDQLIEGMNKRPLDSLNQLSEKNRRKKKAHLYRKRASFKYEIVQTLNELRYVP